MPPDAVPAPLPLLVIGGYLGAGKTTLVNHLLRQAGGRRIAVLVNDFGDINIDADLMDVSAAASDGGSASVISLSGGCLCCSFGDDLVGSLVALTRRHPPPEAVMIELSGVALPAAVVRTARLAPGVALAGTLVVADAALLQRQAADRYVGDTVRQQLADADWLVLNKPDLAGDATLAALQTWLAGALSPAPRARVLACAVTALPAELLWGWADSPDLAAAAPSDQDAAADDAALDRLAAKPWQGLAGPPAATVFESQQRALPPGTDLAALGVALASQPGVLRAKGLALDADGQGQLLQVAGGRWAVTPASFQGGGRLVLIGLRGQLPDSAAAP